MNRTRTRILLVLVVVCALAGAGDLLSQSGKPDGFGVGSLIVAATGVVAMLGSVLTDQLTELRKKRADDAEQLAKAVLQPERRLPLVREITERPDIWVHPVPGSATRSQMPAYIERDFDTRLREAIGRAGFTLLVGDAAAGKTRSAVEAMRAVLPEHVLITPTRAADIAAAVAEARTRPACVLWLDNLPRFLEDDDGITRKDIIEVLAGTGHHRVILATMRAIDEVHLTGGLPGLGQADPFLHLGQDVLERAQRIFVERLFSTGERVRASELARLDDRLAEALLHAGGNGVGIAEYLAWGPQLYRLWQDVWARGASPRAAALIAAAVDCRRAGYMAPLPRALLEGLHAEYLREHGGAQLAPEDLATAWVSVGQLHESVSALARSIDDDDRYEVFDYLVDKHRREHGEVAPEGVARAALEYAGPADAGAIAAVAWSQSRYELARDAAERQYAALSQQADASDLDILAVRGNRVVTMLEVARLANNPRGLPAAEDECRAVLAALAVRPLAGPELLLRARGNLATVLSRQRKWPDAEAEFRRALLDAAVLPGGDPAVLATRGNFATVLYRQGKWPEAEAEFRAVIAASGALDTEHPSMLVFRNSFAMLLTAQGKLTEAETELRSVLEICRRTLGPDHPDTLMSSGNLATVLAAGR